MRSPAVLVRQYTCLTQTCSPTVDRSCIRLLSPPTSSTKPQPASSVSRAAQPSAAALCTFTGCGIHLQAAWRDSAVLRPAAIHQLGGTKRWR